MKFLKVLVIIFYLFLSSLVSLSARAEYFAELSYKLWNGDCPKDLKNPSPGIVPRSTIICSGNSETERINLLRTSYGKVAESAFLASLAQTRSQRLSCTQMQITHLQNNANDKEKFVEDFNSHLQLLGYAKRRMVEIKATVPFDQKEREQYERFRKSADLILATLPYNEISAFRQVIDYVVSQHERYTPDRIDGWIDKQSKDMIKKAIPKALAQVEKNKASLDKGVSSIGLSLTSDEKESLAQDTDLVESFRNEHLDIQNELKPIACRVDSKYGRGAESRDLTLSGISLVTPIATAQFAKLASIGLATSITGAAAVDSISLRTAQVFRLLVQAGGTAASLSQLTKTCLSNEETLKFKSTKKSRTCEKNILESKGPGKCLLIGALSAIGFKATSKSARLALGKIVKSADSASAFADPVARLKFTEEIKTNPQLAIWRLAESRHEAESIKLTQEIEAGLRSSEMKSFEEITGSASQPLKVTLENGLVGVWKRADARLASADAEIAAYKIDQMLRLNLVPITVEKEIKGVKGSIQLFVDGIDKTSLRTKPKSLKFFDTFIYNADRKSDNYATILGRPVGFDHSISFNKDFDMGPKFHDDLKIVLAPFEKQTRIATTLEKDLAEAERRNGKDSEAFLKISKRIEPQLLSARQKVAELKLTAKNELSVLLPDASVYERFKSISDHDWTNALQSHLSKEELSALLSRRNQLVHEIEKTKATLGENIFRDGPLSPMERPAPLSPGERAVRELLRPALNTPDSDATVSAHNIPMGSAHELESGEFQKWVQAIEGEAP